jgi:hypothetical protein
LRIIIELSTLFIFSSIINYSLFTFELFKIPNKMAIEITGKIVNILPPVTGEGKNGPWKKQEFIIETTDQYPKKVLFSVWGDKVNMQSLTAGADVKVSFNPESREYNGKWYTDLRAWRIEAAGAPSTNYSPSAAPQGQSEEYNSFAPPTSVKDDLPF